MDETALPSSSQSSAFLASSFSPEFDTPRIVEPSDGDDAEESDGDDDGKPNVKLGSGSGPGTGG